jgi:plasmid stabilization system protein ParE
MGQVIWSPSALNDIDAIAEYIARDSVDGVALFVSRIVETTDQLQKFSLSGRVIPEIGDSFAGVRPSGRATFVSAKVAKTIDAPSGLIEWDERQL